MWFNNDARDAHVDCTHKATKYYTRGKLGHQIDKQTRILEVVNDEERENIRGSILIDAIITRTIEMTNEVLTMNASNDACDQIYKHFNEVSNQFDIVRQTETM